MYFYQHRNSLIAAALERKLDAKALQEKNRYQAAIYLKGYQLECFLKARVLEMHGFNSLNELVKKGYSREAVFSHNLGWFLMKIEEKTRNFSKDNKDLLNKCKVWSSENRYCPAQASKRECEVFFKNVDKLINNLEKGGTR